MKGKILVILSAVAVFSLAALVSATVGQDGGASDLDVYLEGTTVLCEGKVAEVKAGGIAAVVLEENASTGYVWEYVVEPEGIMVEEGKESFAKTEKKLMGAPKTAAWKFRAESAGFVTLTFNYLRPWEGEEGVAKTVIFDVRIVE
jgi:predicted secreted protein